MIAPNYSRSCSPSAPLGFGATNVLLIANPASRNGRKALPSVLEVLRDAGIRAEIAETTGPLHAIELVRTRILAKPGVFDAVLALGGDGTAMEVATALAEIPDAPPLGIIAVGTANVFARTLGIPHNGVLDV